MTMQRLCVVLLSVVITMAAADTCWIDMPFDIDFQHNQGLPQNIAMIGSNNKHATFDGCKASCENTPGCVVVHWCNDDPANGSGRKNCWGATKVNYKGRNSGCAKATNARVGACAAPCPAGSGCSTTKRYAILDVPDTTWPNALELCRDNGGRLPTYNNAAETQAFLDMGLANSKGIPKDSFRPWMALSDEHTPFEFRVADGIGAHEDNFLGRLVSTGPRGSVTCNAPFCNWHVSNPSGDGTRTETIYEIIGGNAPFSGQWNDVTGGFSRDVVCEYDYLPLPSASATTCSSSCVQHVCTEGDLIQLKVTGVPSNDVWGDGFFTDDSSVGAAAVFAGLVAVGDIATVTLKCSGAKPSFASGSANGVTTQAFASSWPSTFTFNLGGAKLPPPPPSPLRCYHEGCASGRCAVQGTSFNIMVIGVVSNNVWGSDFFSDDSWVGAAAVHQGLIQPGNLGSVTVSCTGPRAALTGSTQNGVVSQSFGAWQSSYILSAGPVVPAPIVDDSQCVENCLVKRCIPGNEMFLRVTGTTHGYLWGSTRYTDDTYVSTAAVHAGLLAPGEVGIVKATCTGPQSSYTGTTAFGITTQSHGPWGSSFTLSAGTGKGALACAPGATCLNTICSTPGRTHTISVTGSTQSGIAFYGASLYTDDSPPSHAGVHAGLLLDGETKLLYVTCRGPKESYAGTTANGLTSTAWNEAWWGSYTLSATP